MSDHENKPILIGDVGVPKSTRHQSQSGTTNGADIAADMLVKHKKTATNEPQKRSATKNEVTMIEAQKRAGRYNVYLNGKYAFPISESVMIKYRIFKGMVIDKTLQTEIIAADDVSKAYNRALDYLSGQLRSEKEVTDKLKVLEIDDGVIELTLERLREFNLLDDQAYASAYVRTMRNTTDKGPIVIRQHLRQKGIGENLIDNALVEFKDDELVENGIAAAEKLAKHYARKPFSTQKQKVIQGLMTKGFQRETIDQVMSQIELTRDEDTETDLLTHEAEKVWHRNQRYKGRERLNRTKRTLYGKGYQFDDINRVLDALMDEEN